MLLGATGRLSLLRRNRNFALLFWATAGSAVGTYLAALALSVHVYDETGSGRWLAALLIADFLPIVLIGLTLGPLVDRLSRKRLMIASDLVRAATFVLMPFVHEPSTIVAVAAVNGIATGFFRPAVWAGLPNLVTDEEREQATSLLTTVENVAWTLGPALAGLLLAFDGVDVAYWTNAVTFLVSAILVSRIPARSLRSDDRITKGHWRELREGLGLVAGSRPLVTVLVVWGTAAVATACINVAEVIFAKHDLGAGNLGLGLLVSATGVGLVIGSFFAASALSTFGMRRVYPGALALMAAGFGLAAASPTIVLAAVLAAVATVGNGTAIVCNQVLVQRGAPDAMRGRALAVLMSTYYAILGLSMAGGGLLVDSVGARTSWADRERHLPRLGGAGRSSHRGDAGGASRCDGTALRSRADQGADGGDRRDASARAAANGDGRDGARASGRRESGDAVESGPRWQAEAGRRTSSSPASSPAIAARLPGRSRSSRTASRTARRSSGACIRAPDAPHPSASPGLPASASRHSSARSWATRASLVERVGVVSVDPSSPFTQGALLGDRIRLADHFLDPDVYIRSMGTRGHLGGLAEATLQALLLVDASGKDVVFLETVGTGQSEVEVVGIADVVLLVLMPGSGDAVQALKAGIMEIPDVIVVNKIGPSAGNDDAPRGSLDRGARPGSRAPARDPSHRGAAGRRCARALGRARGPPERGSTSAGELDARRERNLRGEVEALAVARVRRLVRRAMRDDAAVRGARRGRPAP